ncbi:hypothetical protein [Stenotrophomonas sp. 169]|uniref:hypothetical protein n=1 Tax=Stenotrophomonas sp. 169 TaxID=2770322 RepID=UPI001CB77076|nr:hypothetical protein [Stenotrophomonas sp. 169]
MSAPVAVRRTLRSANTVVVGATAIPRATAEFRLAVTRPRSRAGALPGLYLTIKRVWASAAWAAGSDRSGMTRCSVAATGAAKVMSAILAATAHAQWETYDIFMVFLQEKCRGCGSASSEVDTEADAG